MCQRKSEETVSSAVFFGESLVRGPHLNRSKQNEEMARPLEEIAPFNYYLLTPLDAKKARIV